MKLSAKTDYACRALVELSLHWPNEAPVQIGEIARQQDVPIKFLTHILIHLKQLGCVQSLRGKNGGYLLAKPPQEIILADVITGFGGLELAPDSNSSKNSRPLDQIWIELEEKLLQELRCLNMEEIANRTRRAEKSLTFDI